MNLTRRGLLEGAAALVVVAHLPDARAASEGPGDFNAFVAVTSDGRVQISIPSVEMGQGVTTALPQLVADELDVDFADIDVVHAPVKRDFRMRMVASREQFTGGSLSVQNWNRPLREAGASARWMLVAAAAARWGVDPATCSTERGVVHHPTGQHATYGELAAEAALQKAPKRVALRRPGTHVGKSLPRNDLEPKVRGTATFGIDVRLDGMVYASIRACPVFGGRVASVDDAAVRKRPGVLDVLVFEDFVAVVAEGWWPANQAVNALSITWDEGEHAALDSEGVSSALHAGLQTRGAVAHKHGNVRNALGPDALQAVYEVPYLDQAPIEPLNCTVHIADGRCRIWTGTQVQTPSIAVASRITGLNEADIELTSTLLGGAFGRRGNTDFVERAVHVAMRVTGPVQVIWSREECVQHGFYRPAAVCRLRGSVKDGALHALQVHVAADNALERYVSRVLLGLVKAAKTFPLEGLGADCRYDIPHVRAECSRVDLPVPVGFWRSVGFSHNSFFLESFVDELAHAAGTDPVAFRLAMLTHEPRLANVLRTVADKAGWGSPPEGRFQGVAMMEAYGSICAQVAEVSMEAGVPRVHKVTAVVDCGEVVNPDIVDAQVMGAVLFGLSAALGERLDLSGGRITQGNFHDYPLLRMNAAPEVEVHTTRLPESPIGGIGEVGTPPVAPAVCNAIFAASGIRIRSLPLLASLASEAS